MDQAIIAGTKAQTIYTALSGEPASDYQLILPIELGQAYEANGERVLAAMQYQRIMKSLALYKDNSTLVPMAVSRWLRLRYAIEDSGDLEAALAQGLCATCEALAREIYMGRPIPLMRVPPIMPPRVKHSGIVVAMFDLSDDGQVTNIRIAASSDTDFHKAAERALSTWRYSRAADEDDSGRRKDILTRLDFILRNGRGERIEAKSMKTYIDAPGLKAALRKNADMDIIGTPMRR